MSRTERLCTIERLLQERRAVPLGDFLQQLGISRATFKRDMEYLRERLNAPIIWNRSVGGYRLDATSGTTPTYELPGLWFTASELYALLAAHKLLSEIEPGVLAPHIAPLRARLETALAASGHSVLDIAQRVRLLSMGKRSVEPRFFAAVSAALLERKRIEIEATNRERDEINHRILSPLRHGRHVEVEAPKSLRLRVVEEIAALSEIYR